MLKGNKLQFNLEAKQLIGLQIEVYVVNDIHIITIRKLMVKHFVLRNIFLVNIYF